MPIEATCQSCSGQFRLPDSAAGKKIRCPKCKRPLEVPAVKKPAFALPTEETLPPTPLPQIQSPAVSAPPPPKLPADEWHLKTADGEEYGPVSRSELDEWFGEGRITSDCRFLGGAGDEWQPAAEICPQLNSAPVQVHEPESPEPPAVEIENPLPKFKAAARPQAPAPVASDATAEDRSQRSRIVAGFLGVFLGPLGIHRFYLGYWGIGLAMLFTGGGLVLWSLIDSIFVMVGRVPDADGRPLSD